MRLPTLAILLATTAAALGQAGPTHTPRPEPTEQDQRILEALAVLEGVRPQPVDRLERRQPSAADYRQVPADIATMPTLKFRVVRTLRTASDVAPLEMEERITRSATTLSLDAPSLGHAWLFTQNTRFPERAIGYMIDFEQRQVLEYEDTDLRVAGVARDWVDVLALGFEMQWLETCEQTGQTREVAGHTFHQYLGEPAEAGQPSREIWWSQDLLLPLEITITLGERQWKQQIVDLEPVSEAAPRELQHPSEQRLVRTFTRMTLGDWYDLHYGCGCALPGSGVETAMRRPQATPAPAPAIATEPER
ncbi:MAG: hypothetical protein ACIAQU_03145 [Phycisphaerales bacterium JB064]